MPPDLTYIIAPTSTVAGLLFVAAILTLMRLELKRRRKLQLLHEQTQLIERADSLLEMAERIEREMAAAASIFAEMMHREVELVALEEKLLSEMIAEVAAAAKMDVEVADTGLQAVDDLLAEVAAEVHAVVEAEKEAERQLDASLLLQRLFRGHAIRKVGRPLTPIGVFERRRNDFFESVRKSRVTRHALLSHRSFGSPGVSLVALRRKALGAARALADQRVSSRMTAAEAGEQALAEAIRQAEKDHSEAMMRELALRTAEAEMVISAAWRRHYLVAELGKKKSAARLIQHARQSRQSRMTRASLVNWAEEGGDASPANASALGDPANTEVDARNEKQSQEEPQDALEAARDSEGGRSQERPVSVKVSAKVSAKERELAEQANRKANRAAVVRKVASLVLLEEAKSARRQRDIALELLVAPSWWTTFEMTMADGGDAAGALDDESARAGFSVSRPVWRALARQNADGQRSGMSRKRRWHRSPRQADEEIKQTERAFVRVAFLRQLLDETKQDRRPGEMREDVVTQPETSPAFRRLPKWMTRLFPWYSAARVAYGQAVAIISSSRGRLAPIEHILPRTAPEPTEDQLLPAVQDSGRNTGAASDDAFDDLDLLDRSLAC